MTITPYGISSTYLFYFLNGFDFIVILFTVHACYFAVLETYFQFSFSLGGGMF